MGAEHIGVPVSEAGIARERDGLEVCDLSTSRGVRRGITPDQRDAALAALPARQSIKWLRRRWQR